MAWQPDAVQRALSVWADEVRPLAASMTFQIIARVLSEARFRRTDLRRALADLVARDKPRWRFADPAQLQIAISEFHDGQYVTGLRLSDSGTRQHGARDAGREGGLPPTLAAAMVDLAGAPGRVGRTLLDPCCGAGTVLAEALAAGWAAEGTDIDAAAVEAAARNAPGATVQLGDARELLLPGRLRGCVRVAAAVRAAAPPAGRVAGLGRGGTGGNEQGHAHRRISGPAGAGAAQAGDPGRAPAPPPGAYPADRIGADDLGIPPGLASSGSALAADREI